MRIITAQDAGFVTRYSMDRNQAQAMLCATPLCVNCYTSLLRTWPDVSYRFHQGVPDSWTWSV